MARRRHPHPDRLLSRLISIRLPGSEYIRLEKLASQSDCRSIGELIRRHLAGKPVRVYYRDTTRDNFLEELAAIRQELHLIGININQLTRHFNGSTQPAKRVMLAHQTLEAYRQVDRRVGLLLSLIAKLAQQW